MPLPLNVFADKKHEAFHKNQFSQAYKTDERNLESSGVALKFWIGIWKSFQTTLHMFVIIWILYFDEIYFLCSIKP